MKHAGWMLLAGGLCAALAAEASEYDDFRIPDHRWRTRSASMSGQWSGADDGVEDAESTVGSGRADGRLGAEWFRDSETRQHRFGASLGVEGGRSSRDVARFSDFSGAGAISFFRFGNEESASRSLNESLAAYGQWREYPWSSPWGAILNATVLGGWNQAWTNWTSETIDRIDGLDRRYLDVQDTERWRYEYALVADARFGRGRVRDATGVHSARVLVERLRADRRLVREPSAPAILRLAALFYVEPGFAAPHDLPRRFFWREVERVLREDGAIGDGGLDAFEALHALEPLVAAVGRYRRPIGWFAGPVIQFEHRRMIDRWASRSHLRSWQSDSLTGESAFGQSRRSETWRDLVLAGAVLEAHRPIGHRTQVDLQVAALADVEGLREYSRALTAASVAHLVDERWYAWASGSHERVIGRQEFSGDLWRAGVDLGVRYYLEDRWNVTLSLGHWQEEAGHPPTMRGEFRRSQWVQLGVGWDTGALDLPGLAEPVRPLR